MNILRLNTEPTLWEDTYRTFWMTGLQTKGTVVVKVAAHIADASIVAELSAARYLLEGANVCGHDKAGAGLSIYFSGGQPRKLLREDSDKPQLAPYALFLRTRFLGAEINVSKDKSWIDSLCHQRIDECTITKAAMELIAIPAIGEVGLTAHAVQKYCERFQRPLVRAWREIKSIAAGSVLATRIQRRAIHDIKHRAQAVYAVNFKRRIALVIGDQRVVTILNLDADGVTRFEPRGRDEATETSAIRCQESTR